VRQQIPLGEDFINNPCLFAVTEKHHGPVIKTNPNRRPQNTLLDF
jgi:hypothetical protein